MRILVACEESQAVTIAVADGIGKLAEQAGA